jgi:two-component system sensor histidine kinase UhpB
VWTVPRAGGTFWTVSLAASHESERREAMGSFVDMLALLLVCVAGLLLVMHWNLRLAFAPLGRLLEAIAGIEQHDAQAVRSLPTMPIRELESVAVALRHLGAALDAAEAHRRLLSQQVLTLQEDERARLARDLHDEFGQRLTALRVDAAWLARQVHDQPALKDVVDGMAAQCALVQADIRSLLTRLQPFGPPTAAAQDAESLARGLALLQALVNSWHGGERPGGMTCRLELQWQDADGLVQPFPEGTEAEGMGWPRPLWLTIYRISQEALTNSARHAQAGELALSLHCRGGRLPGQALRIDWQARDDGIGLPTTRSAALPRGNGLAGLQERVWAQGGELQLAPWRPGHARPGLVLGAGFDTCLQALPDGQNRFVAVLGEPR